MENYAPGLKTTACRFLPQKDVAKVVSATAAPDHTLSTMTINPAAIPAGTELFFGYVNNLHFDHRDNVRGLGNALVEKGCSISSGN